MTTLIRIALLALASSCLSASPERPNIILVMTDDQGWAQTGYYGHPALKTPHLDAMAKNGLRFDRFYAAGPVCSPTRASVFTGRTPERTGVPTHGHALRHEERTLPEALQQSGYATAHFGKWHLNGLRGPGAPVLKEDTHHPGTFGFDYWLTVTNFFDVDPIISRNGSFEEFQGDTSSILVDEALRFIEDAHSSSQPYFVVIWDGSPHRPFVALPEHTAGYEELDEKSRHHYGELTAFDEAVGELRRGLRELGSADNTIIWFCSDNGGLGDVTPSSVGELRGFKGSVWEGGIRVPGILEWPRVVKPGVTDFPASTMDIFPTIVDILGLSEDLLLKPVDGASLVPLLNDQEQRQADRQDPIGFRFLSSGALILNDLKIVCTNERRQTYELFDLAEDRSESVDLAHARPQDFSMLRQLYMKWCESVDASIAGADYSTHESVPPQPERGFWSDDPRYKPYFSQWKHRPEYQGFLQDR